METTIPNSAHNQRQYELFENNAIRDPLCFDVFFDEGPFGIIMLDRYFQIIKVNKKFSELYNSVPVLTGDRSLFDLLEEENAIVLRSVLRNVNRQDSSLFTHLRFMQQDDSLLITDAYIRQYEESNGEMRYCVLLFQSEFCPDRLQLEIENKIYQTIVDTQEEDRKNIGSALHDSVAQSLYGMRLNLQHYVLKHGDANHLLPVKRLLNEVIHTIRNISTELYPSVIDEFGLGAAIKSMADRFSFPGFKVVFFFQDRCEEIPKRMKFAIYRVVQELLNNGMKHAMANHVIIRVIRLGKSDIQVEVSDNGRGFDEQIHQTIDKGSGLRNIRSRIKLFNGDIQILDNHPGSKVLVRLRIPQEV